MKGLRLNLGRFNDCVDYLLNGQPIEYPVDSGRKMFYYTAPNNPISSVRIVDNSFNVPIYSVGEFIEEGRISDKDVINRFLAKIELRIFAMMEVILKESDSNLRLENILLPVRNIEISDNDKSDGCYGWVEMGIAVVV